MRGLLASLLVAVFFLVVSLIAAAFGAVGLAAIGLLLNRWFDLTQWQGTLVALAAAFGLGFLIYRMTQGPTTPSWESDWEDEDDEDEDDAFEEDDEPPIVPWRRSRPTPGKLPVSGSGRSKPRK